MSKVLSHIKFIFENRTFPNHVDVFAYGINLFIFAVLVFFSFDYKLYEKIKSMDLLVDIDLPDVYFFAFFFVLVAIVLILNVSVITPDNDMHLFKSLELSDRVINSIIAMRMAPYLILLLIAFVVKSISLITALSIFFVIVVSSLLALTAVDIREAIDKIRVIDSVAYKMVFSDKWMCFIHAEIASNISILYFHSMFIVITLLSVLIGRSTNSQLLFFIILMLLMYGMIEDLFYKKNFKTQLYVSIGLDKRSYFKYCCIFCISLFYIFYLIFFIFFAIACEIDIFRELLLLIVLSIYGAVFISGHIALRLMLYHKKNMQFISLAYAFSVFLPIVPLIMLLRNVIITKRYPYFEEDVV